MCDMRLQLAAIIAVIFIITATNKADSYSSPVRQNELDRPGEQLAHRRTHTEDR